jgi:hypothetical protein
VVGSDGKEKKRSGWEWETGRLNRLPRARAQESAAQANFAPPRRPLPRGLWSGNCFTCFIWRRAQTPSNGVLQRRACKQSCNRANLDAAASFPTSTTHDPPHGMKNFFAKRVAMVKSLVRVQPILIDTSVHIPGGETAHLNDGAIPYARKRPGRRLRTPSHPTTSSMAPQPRTPWPLQGRSQAGAPGRTASGELAKFARKSMSHICPAALAMRALSLHGTCFQ